MFWLKWSLLFAQFRSSTCASVLVLMQRRFLLFAPYNCILLFGALVKFIFLPRHRLRCMETNCSKHPQRMLELWIWIWFLDIRVDVIYFHNQIVCTPALHNKDPFPSSCLDKLHHQTWQANRFCSGFLCPEQHFVYFSLFEIQNFCLLWYSCFHVHMFFCWN